MNRHPIGEFSVNALMDLFLCLYDFSVCTDKFLACQKLYCVCVCEEVCWGLVMIRRSIGKLSVNGLILILLFMCGSQSCGCVLCVLVREKRFVNFVNVDQYVHQLSGY